MIRTELVRHASGSMELGAGDALILGSMLACLALFVFVLACSQWRLSARARLRLLLCTFVSLAWAFCGLCWYDVCVRKAALGPKSAVASPLQQLIERTAAAMVTMGALVFGLVALAVILWLDRRAGQADRREGEQ
jgi:uncharacterized membrane protein YciS (DUF1049 family)